MNKSSELIKLLAKITEISSVETSFCQEKYKDLFYLLKEDFYTRFSPSLYDGAYVQAVMQAALDSDRASGVRMEVIAP